MAELRPPRREAFLRLHTFPGEQAQADGARFGEVKIGRARRLSAFLLTLSYSRALGLEFFLDQSLENFLLGHVNAFSDWGGAPRTVLYDNSTSVVLERRGDANDFHPRLLEFSAHYHFAARTCRPARGNEKGRVERPIQYARASFLAARPFTTLAHFNRQALQWREAIAHQRPWPGDDSRSVAQVFEAEKPRLLQYCSHKRCSGNSFAIRSGVTPLTRSREVRPPSVAAATEGSKFKLTPPSPPWGRRGRG